VPFIRFNRSHWGVGAFSFCNCVIGYNNDIPRSLPRLAMPIHYA
jgi:hypothetical protein